MSCGGIGCSRMRDPATRSYGDRWETIATFSRRRHVPHAVASWLRKSVFSPPHSWCAVSGIVLPPELSDCFRHEEQRCRRGQLFPRGSASSPQKSFVVPPRSSFFAFAAVPTWWQTL